MSAVEEEANGGHRLNFTGTTLFCACARQGYDAPICPYCVSASVRLRPTTACVRSNADTRSSFVAPFSAIQMPFRLYGTHPKMLSQYHPFCVLYNSSDPVPTACNNDPVHFDMSVTTCRALTTVGFHHNCALMLPLRKDHALTISRATEAGSAF